MRKYTLKKFQNSLANRCNFKHEKHWIPILGSIALINPFKIILNKRTQHLCDRVWIYLSELTIPI
jgi:hypothetical protein